MLEIGGAYFENGNAYCSRRLAFFIGSPIEAPRPRGRRPIDRKPLSPSDIVNGRLRLFLDSLPALPKGFSAQSDSQYYPFYYMDLGFVVSPCEAKIGHHLAQLGVLLFELLEPAHFGRQQPVIFALPVEVGRLADPGLSADLSTGMPSAPCLRMNAFWTSENFEAFIVLRSSQLGNQIGKL
jgi:hypothetical protein